MDHSTYPDYAYDIKVNGKDVNTIKLYLRRPSKAETAEWNKNKEKTATQASAAASKDGESTFGKIALGIRNIANSAKGAFNAVKDKTEGYFESSESSQKQQHENAQTTDPNTIAQNRKVGPTGTPPLSRSESEVSESETNTFSSSLTQDEEQAEKQAKQDVEEVELDVEEEFENLKKKIKDSGCEEFNTDLKTEEKEKCVNLLKQPIDDLFKDNNKDKPKHGKLYARADEIADGKRRGRIRGKMSTYRSKIMTVKRQFSGSLTSPRNKKQEGGARSKKKKHSKKHRKNSRKKSRSMKRIKKLKK